MNSAYVILNYHDETRVISLSNSIALLDPNSKIIIVNNNDIGDASFDESKFNSPTNIILLPSNGNIGYARGYNIGFRYALDYIKFDYLFSVNSDVIFSKDLIHKCERVLSCNKDIGLISSRMKTNGEETCCCWSLPTYKEYLKGNFFHFQKREPYFFPFSTNCEFCHVDVVRASFFCITYNALSKVKGYSKNVFLYDNENLLSVELLNAGYKEAVLTNFFYLHNHKTGKNNYKLLKYSWHDHLYYLKKHLKISHFKSFLFTLTFFCYYSVIVVKNIMINRST